jgi:O-antigen/teichoic acid export membrane protein
MIRNVGLSSGLNLYRALIQFALNFALAHYLLPSDFGQVALILPVTLFILLVGDFGLSAAIIRSSATAREAGAASAICLFYGVSFTFITVILYAIGVFDGWVGQTAELLVAFSVVALLSTTAIIPRAMLERRLAYGRIAVVETLANSSAFLVSVIAASLGAGVWAFACYHIIMQLSRAVYFWIATRREIEFNTRWRTAIPLMAFGGWVVAFNLVNYLARNLDRYIIGGLLGTGLLGLYALAYQVMLVPMMALTWPASGVLLSTLSRFRDDGMMMRRSFLAMLGLAAMVTFPMMTGLALRSGLVFPLLLPERWHDVAPIISRLAIAGGLQSSTAFVGALFLVRGRARQQFWIGGASTLAVLATLAFATWYWRSLESVANAYVAITLLLSVGYYGLMARMLGTGIGTVLGALVPAVVLTVVASAVAIAAEAMLRGDSGPWLRASIFTGAFCASAIAMLTIRRSALVEAFGTLRSAGIRAAA